MIDRLKPYSKYEHSNIPWLDKMPSHWEAYPGLAAFREKQIKNIGMLEKQVLSLSYGRIVVKPADKLHGLVPDSFSTYQVVNPGDIIIRATDLQNDRTSLRVGLVRDRGIITSAYMCLKTTEKLIPEYGYLLLHAYDVMKVFYGMGSGLRQNLAYADIKRMPMFVPPKEEQVAIARFLDHINQRIERTIRAKRKVIALLNEQKQAVIQRAVTRGLDPNVAYKNSGVPWLGNIPKHWDVKRLKNIVQLNPSKFEIAGMSHELEVTFLPMEKVSSSGKIDLTENVKLGKVRNGFTYIREGDVIIAKITPCFENGKGAICSHLKNGIAFGSTEFHVLRPKATLSKLFLYYITQCPTVRTMGAMEMRGSAGQQRVPVEFYANLYIPVPNKQEQNAITDFLQHELKKYDDTIDRTKKQIVLLREYAIRLATDVVTGKIDVSKGQLPEYIDEHKYNDSDEHGDNGDDDTPPEEVG